MEIEAEHLVIASHGLRCIRSITFLGATDFAASTETLNRLDMLEKFSEGQVQFTCRFHLKAQFRPI